MLYIEYEIILDGQSIKKISFGMLKFPLALFNTKQCSEFQE